MFRSLSLEDLTEPQRQCFAILGIGPGDRLYIRKLRPLSDTELDDERRRQLRRDVTTRDLSLSLAQVFNRNHKTIARRLRNLSVPPTTGDPA